MTCLSHYEEFFFKYCCLGGDKRDRTADLLNAIQALSQLSYTPELVDCFLQLVYDIILYRRFQELFLFFM